MDNGELKEFASAAKHYVDLVNEDNELPSTSSREDCIVSLESSDVCGMGTGIRASSWWTNDLRHYECQRGGRVEANVTQAPGRDYKLMSRDLVNQDEKDSPIAPCS